MKFILSCILALGVLALGVEITGAVIGIIHGAYWLTLMALLVAGSTVAIGRIEWRAWRNREREDAEIMRRLLQPSPPSPPSPPSRETGRQIYDRLRVRLRRPSRSIIGGGS